MPRPPLVRFALGIALLLVCPVGAQASAAAPRSGGHLTAALDGRATVLSDVGRFHCHDLAYPQYTCFTTAARRDMDMSRALALRPTRGRTSGLPAVTLGVQAVTYVLAYEHINYGGSSLALSVPVTDLGAIGWSNRISSFKSTNGGRPEWWDWANYAGFGWQWGISVWVANTGDYGANDRFSSVRNAP